MNVNITKQKIQLVKKTTSDHLTRVSVSYVKTNKAKIHLLVVSFSQVG
jgi:hypothetical protein